MYSHVVNVTLRLLGDGLQSQRNDQRAYRKFPYAQRRSSHQLPQWQPGTFYINDVVFHSHDNTLFYSKLSNILYAWLREFVTNNKERCHAQQQQRQKTSHRDLDPTRRLHGRCRLQVSRLTYYLLLL